MSEYMYLLGSEDVKHAAYEFRAAVDQFHSLVSSFNDTVYRLEKILEEDRNEREQKAEDQRERERNK